MINLQYSKRIIQLTGPEKGLATGAHTRNKLKREFMKLLAAQPDYSNPVTMSVNDSTLIAMVRKYSEQFVFQPLDEIKHWMGFNGGLYYEPGYPDLHYSVKKKSDISQNKSAIAGVGEGVAGFLAQRLYQCKRMSRPNHDFPDIVMTSGAGGYADVYMVESKASSISESNVKKEIDDELPRMTSFLVSCGDIDHRTIAGLLIGTAVMKNSPFLHCSCFITEVRVS